MRKQKKNLLGVYLNLSKTGITTTVGPRAAYLNTRIAETGLYSRQKIGGGNGSSPSLTPTNNFTSNTDVVKLDKSKTTTILLAFFLGAFGVHRFYLGEYGKGIFSILFCWTFIPTIISLIDVIVFAVMSQEKFDEKYNTIMLDSTMLNSPVQNCSGCGTALTFMTSPNFGVGKLTDGGRVCRTCFGEIVKVDVSFGMYSSKEYDTNLVYEVLSGSPSTSLSLASSNNSSTTSIATNQSLEELKNHIEEVRQERQELESEIKQKESSSQRLERNLKNKQNGIGEIFTKKETFEKLQTEIAKAKEYLSDLYSQYEEIQAYIYIESDEDFQVQYQKVKAAYIELSKSDKIWNIISESETNETESADKSSIGRKEVIFTFDEIDFIFSEHSTFHLENADGDNLYIYPAFILQMNNSGAITLIDLHELKFRFHRQRLLEETYTTPNDTQIIEYTWAKMNKDGSPDKRFLSDCRIPLVEYGVFEFSTNNGLKEVYYISNVQLSENFANEFTKYLSLLNPTKDFTVPDIALNSNGVKTNDFSYQYYSLLKDFSKSVYQIVQKLQTNEAILEQISGGQLETAPSQFIANCVIYDMIQISNTLSKGKLPTKSLEATGLVLATTQIVPNNNVAFLDKDFDIIALAHQKGLYKDVAQDLIDMFSLENPLQITVQETQDEEVISSTKSQNNLSFPTFLKISDNPLFEEYATVLYRYATIVSKADNIVTTTEENILKHIYQLTHNPIPEKENNALHISKGNKNESLDEVLSELNSLIGLNEVKSEINTLINFIKVQKAREAAGLKSSSLSYHIVFTGNPGTGKTTVARIVSKIYKHLGILTEGQLVETDRSGLVAEYVGQTAVKVNKTVNSALNGVLFIDEAYSLVGENKDDFGKEAVATLVKRMEDDRDKLVLILAGYTNEMKDFIDTNPGFKSRFNRYIIFPDYTSNELFDIFESLCRKLDYNLTEAAITKLKITFENAYQTRDKSFGNGRFARNIFEKTLEQQANRIAKESNLTKELLTTIIEDDISE